MVDLQKANPTLACRLRSYDSVSSCLKQMQSTDNDRDSRMGDPSRYNKGIIQGPLRDNSSKFDGSDSISNRSANTHINTNNRNLNTNNKRQKQNGNQSGFGSDGDISYRTMTSAASGFSFSANLREREAETAAQRGSMTHQPNPNRDNNDYRDIVIANEDVQLVYPAGVVGKAMILPKNKKKENLKNVSNSSNNDIDTAILEDFREEKSSNNLENRKRQRSDETNWERLDAERWATHDNNTPRKKKSQNEKGFGDRNNNNNNNNNNSKNNNGSNMSAASMKINQQKANTHTQRMKASGLNETSNDTKNGKQKYVRGSEPVQNLGSRSVVQTNYNDRSITKKVLDKSIEKGPARRFGDNNNNNSSSSSSNNNSNNNKNSSAINVYGKESNKSNTSKRAKLKNQDVTDAKNMKSSSNNSRGGKVERNQFTVRLQ